MKSGFTTGDIIALISLLLGFGTAIIGYIGRANAKRDRLRERRDQTIDLRFDSLEDSIGSKTGDIPTISQRLNTLEGRASEDRREMKETLNKIMDLIIGRPRTP